MAAWERGDFSVLVGDDGFSWFGVGCFSVMNFGEVKLWLSSGGGFENDQRPLF